MNININQINQLRHLSRKLIRELGMLQIDKTNPNRTPKHWHALIEIDKAPGITISNLGTLLLLSTSATSRMINVLVKEELVQLKDGLDKREKYLYLSTKGENEIKYIDEFSNSKIIGACEFLTDDDQHYIIDAIRKYGDALEKSRMIRDHIKIHTLPTSRTIRKQIINMIENIQKNEFSIVITPEINAGILKAEEEFYYNKGYNFWYAIDKDGMIIGSIGLKKIDEANAELKKFFVEKSFRGKGVAQKLLQVLLDAAVQHNFKYIFLGTVDVLKAAQSFYKNNGFVQITTKQLPAKFVLTPTDTIFFKGTVSKCAKLVHNN